MRALLRKVTTSSYHLRREYLLARTAWMRMGTRSILVYQMGKVGSTSVARALAAASPNTMVLHFHTLRRERLDEEERTYRGRFAERRRIDGHLVHGLYVRRRLALPRRRPWKIVTLVRDPVARNLSTFFQTLDLHFASLGFADRIRAGDETVEDDLLRFFVDRFPHEEVLSWFDQEIQPFFGVDVLARPFPHGTGYRIYRGEAADVLLIRLEDLNRCAERAFREFLGVGDLEIGARNLGRGKYYAEVYRQARQRLVLPDPLLDRIYGSPMMRALYTPEEIAERRSRWSRG